jgi:hypothetical protein
MKSRNLTLGMGSGIGASAAGNLDFFAQNPGQRLFNFPLYGIVNAGQTLPTPIPGAVIANIKPQIPQATPTPLWLPARCLPRTGNFL